MHVISHGLCLGILLVPNSNYPPGRQMFQMEQARGYALGEVKRKVRDSFKNISPVHLRNMLSSHFSLGRVTDSQKAARAFTMFCTSFLFFFLVFVCLIFLR